MKVEISKEEIYDLYWNKKLNQNEISKKLNIPRPTLQYWFNKYKIQRRSISDANKLSYKNGRVTLKGRPSKLKGIKCSEEAKRKMRESHKGKHYSPFTEFKKGMPSIFKGKRHRKESIEKNREKAIKRLKIPYKRQKLIERVSSYWFKKGIEHPNWDGGITSINENIRKSSKMKSWKKQILKRDNYTCLWCGSKEKLEADHIKPFSLYPELRFDIDNGRTLCKECHIKTETYGYKGNKLEVII